MERIRATQECYEKNRTEYSKIVQKHMPTQSMWSIECFQLQVQFSLDRFVDTKVEVIPSYLFHDADCNRVERKETG